MLQERCSRRGALNEERRGEERRGEERRGEESRTICNRNPGMYERRVWFMHRHYNPRRLTPPDDTRGYNKGQTMGKLPVQHMTVLLCNEGLKEIILTKKINSSTAFDYHLEERDIAENLGASDMIRGSG